MTALTNKHGASLVGGTVFVTGAYGLIGSWLTAALADLGARVVVLRRAPRPTSALVVTGTEARCRVVEGDLRDEGALTRTLAGEGVVAVFHLAAQAIVGTAVTSPRATFEANIAGTWTLMEACRAAGVRRVVAASSDNAYGPSTALPHTEDTPLRALAPYDVSKAAADLIARSYGETYGMAVATARLSNVYGGGDRNASRLIPAAVLAALAGKAPIIRSDGSPRRDFLYVTDAVDAYLAVADLLMAGAGRGQPFNAGAGAPRTVLEVVELICALAGTGVRPEVRGTGTPQGELDEHWADAARLRAATGWTPQISLEDGLRRTIDWYREHPA
jgi:CDP-glucose 4,6-dehydratase